MMVRWQQFTSTSERFGKTKMEKTMSNGLQERQSAPLTLHSSAEPFNASDRCISPRKGVSYPKPDIPVLSGDNSRKRGGMSAKIHQVFVIGVDGKPLTPTTNAKARKLMEGNQARPVWNKFSQFGLRMLVETRKEIPKTILGIDNGTVFEGYTVTTRIENNFAVMWKLPDKKKLVKKLKERRRLRRARRFRNCRRRACRINNRNKDGFIAPSQLQVVMSRIKCIDELCKCYHFDTVAIEDVRFNHKKHKWGKNFSTVEVGKTMINNIFVGKGINIDKYQGHETEKLRKKYGYHKIKCNKSTKRFNTHCSDALAISVESGSQGYVAPTKNFVYVDDSYRCIRRKLHDSQFSKGGVRHKFSKGNFCRIRKGTIVGFDGGSGQLVGGTKEDIAGKEQIWYQDFEMRGKRKVYQKGKMLKKISWLSHHFKYEVISG